MSNIFKSFVHHFLNNSLLILHDTIGNIFVLYLGVALQDRSQDIIGEKRKTISPQVRSDVIKNLDIAASGMNWKHINTTLLNNMTQSISYI